jgi:hypothetical protein
MTITVFYCLTLFKETVALYSESHLTSWSSGYSCFVFRRSQFEIYVRILAILTEMFVTFLSPSKQITGQCLKISPRSLPSTHFPIYHLPIILSFYA